MLKACNLAVAAVVNSEKQVLMMWRHRFITDSWAWELPMGLVEPDETPTEAAVREVLEETGWRTGEMRPLIYAQPAKGSPTPSTSCSAPMPWSTRDRRRNAMSPIASSGSRCLICAA